MSMIPCLRWNACFPPTAGNTTLPLGVTTAFVVTTVVLGHLRAPSCQGSDPKSQGKRLEPGHRSQPAAEVRRAAPERLQDHSFTIQVQRPVQLILAPDASHQIDFSGRFRDLSVALCEMNAETRSSSTLYYCSILMQERGRLGCVCFPGFGEHRGDMIFKEFRRVEPFLMSLVVERILRSGPEAIKAVFCS